MLELRLLEETWTAAEQLAPAEGWTLDDAGVARILSRGLALADESADLALLPASDAASVELNRIARELAAAEAEHAVMKARAFRLWREQAALQAEIDDLTERNLVLRQALAEARRQEEELRAELQRLRSLGDRSSAGQGVERGER